MSGGFTVVDEFGRMSPNRRVGGEARVPCLSPQRGDRLFGELLRWRAGANFDSRGIGAPCLVALDALGAELLPAGASRCERPHRP